MFNNQSQISHIGRAMAARLRTRVQLLAKLDALDSVTLISCFFVMAFLCRTASHTTQSACCVSNRSQHRPHLLFFHY